MRAKDGDLEQSAGQMKLIGERSTSTRIQKGWGVKWTEFADRIVGDQLRRPLLCAWGAWHAVADFGAHPGI